MTTIRRLVIASLTLSALLFGGASTVLAAEGDVDPQAARAILEGAFTLAGATVIATIIAGFIQYALKPLGATVGAWVDAHEQVTSLLLWGCVIVFAIAALGKPLDLVSVFGYFLAWLGGAKLSGAAYDGARAAKQALTGS